MDLQEGASVRRSLSVRVPYRAAILYDQKVGCHLEQLIKDLVSQSAFFPRALLMTLLLFLYRAFVLWGADERKWKPRQLSARWREGLFLFYLCFLLISAVFSRTRTSPFGMELAHFGFRDDVSWNNEIIENVLFFIPFTVFYLTAFGPKAPWLSAFIASASVSCLIEASQLLLWLGKFQLSDLFHNTLGGMIGCALWYAVKTLCRRIRPDRPASDGKERRASGK